MSIEWARTTAGKGAFGPLLSGDEQDGGKTAVVASGSAGIAISAVRLDPSFIAGLVSDAVLSLRDEDRWQEMVDCEREERRKLQLAEKHWNRRRVRGDARVCHTSAASKRDMPWLRPELQETRGSAHVWPRCLSSARVQRTAELRPVFGSFTAR